PQKLTLEIDISGTGYRNKYCIWLYPKRINTKTPDGLMMATDLGDDVISHLETGGKVLLLPELNQLKKSIMGSFQTDYWCYPMFRRAAEKQGIEPAPGTLGILCDPETPALADFPTEFHSNWQWWHLVKNSRPLILDDTPLGYRPIVQVIDNFERNHKLGLLFEANVGEGKLLVCTIDLLGNLDKPEAKQLLYSLQNYAGSSKFTPGSELSIELLKSLLMSE
ncbi:beta-galactosidase, partial [bacterium]|nr:beta-galactosidase [bacterium]